MMGQLNFAGATPHLLVLFWCSACFWIHHLVTS